MSEERPQRLDLSLVVLPLCERQLEDQDEEENSDKNEDDADFENDSSEDVNEASDLSILEKEENLKPHITEKLEKFSKLFKKFKKLREQFIELKLSNKKTMLLSDIYNTAEHPSITANNYSDIYQSYPVFLANSKNNNNIKNWKRPTNGKCSRAEFCGNVYSDTDQQISPEPRPPPLNKPRVNFYEASSSLCE